MDTNNQNRTPGTTWNDEISDLENYFASVELPSHPVRLNSYTTITDCSLFIESHFAVIKWNNGKRTFEPYLTRLQEFKNYIITH